MNDDVLGTLTWNEPTASWDCSVVVSPTTTVEISLIPLGEDIEPLIERARSFVGRFSEFDSKLRQAAADSLLNDRNQLWSDGDAIDAADFMARMSIDRVGFWPSGPAEAYYFDGGLFQGHLIAVPFTDDGSIEEARLEG